MEILDVLAILGLVISSYVFYLYARRVNKSSLTLDSFMLADSSLSKRQFSNTWVASCFSLAMNVMFLLSSSNHYGLWILIAPTTYISGYILFNYVVKNSNVDLRESRTLADFFYVIYPSISIARLVTALTLGAYVLLLFLELYMGTVVMTVFLGNDAVDKTIGFFSIGLLVLMYVRLGGYKAIVKTDKWQLFLIMLAIGSIFVFGLFAHGVNDHSVGEIISSISKSKEEPLSLAIFMTWLATSNLIFAFSQLSNYQRVAATTSKDVSWLGVLHGSWKLLALFLFTIFGFLVLGAKGHQVDNVTDFLLLVKSSDGALSYLFILLIVGFASMVFSSADIAVIAIFYSLSDRNTFRNKFAKMKERQLRKILTNSTVGLLVILSIIYFLQFSGLEAWLMPLIYTVVGQLVILVPVPIYVLIKNISKKNAQKIPVTASNTRILFGSIIVAWALLFISAYISKITDNDLWSLMSMPFGVLIVFFAVFSLKKKQP
jgi:Na+/proline symporter